MTSQSMDQPALTLFNTATRSKQLFSPLEEGKVSLYTCGPTVYNYAHIGNFRTYVFEDLLRRTLRAFGFQVEQVMNITDVDDKTIRGAKEQNISLEAFVRPYREAFFEDLKTLHIQPAEHYPAATDHIPEMIAMIEQLMSKQMAYQGNDGSIYFPIAKFERYGCLSHLQLDQLVAGASQRVALDEYDKENASDFVLWKHYDRERDGSIYWDSPFGPGRPGWHLECSAMAMKWLGETIDIHVGGVDNIFPHHENEIAQSESCSGKTFAKMWMHAEHLVVEGRKMSKKLGNFYTLRDLLSCGYTGREVRYMLLHTHYRTQLNFSLTGMEAARSSLHRLHSFVDRIQRLSSAASSSQANPMLLSLLQQTAQQFQAALADDLNISVALAALFDLVRELNSLCDEQALSPDDACAILNQLRRWDLVLGLLPLDQAASPLPEAIIQLAEARFQARQERDWAKADALRKELAQAGYLVEDSRDGYQLKPVAES